MGSKVVRVVGLDPGGTTGFAFLSATLNMWMNKGGRSEKRYTVEGVVCEALSRGRGVVDLSDAPRQWGCVDEMEGSVAGQVKEFRRRMDVFSRVDVVLCEQYTVRGGQRIGGEAGSASLELQSAFREVCVGMGVKFVMRTAGKKAVASDVRMKEWGLWQPGMPHATDALRHVVMHWRDVRSGAEKEKMAREKRAAGYAKAEAKMNSEIAVAVKRTWEDEFGPRPAKK